eukprot:scaffold7720_cov129-Isochrysis_galbana.AAC.9
MHSVSPTKRIAPTRRSAVATASGKAVRGKLGNPGSTPLSINVAVCSTCGKRAKATSCSSRACVGSHPSGRRAHAARAPTATTATTCLAWFLPEDMRWTCIP